MTTINDLPVEHPLRNQPLQGAYCRYNLLVSHEVTDTPEKIADLIERRKNGERKWGSWKQVDSWKISKNCYNDLGPVWTDYAEWTFDNPKTNQKK